MDDSPSTLATGKQIVLLGVALLLSISGALAVGILLFGEFGETEGRILATTGLLAAYGLLALPAAMLLDRRRLPVLAVTVLTLALTGASLAVAAVWTENPSEVHGKAVGTAAVFLVAGAQVCALVLRRPERDRAVVRRLFALSCLLALGVTTMFAFMLWAEIDSERYGRVLAAVVVLDALAVALQPILARARPGATPIALHLLLESEDQRDVEIPAPDLASAAAKAIRQIEREGHHVVRLDVGTSPRPSSDD